MEQELRARWVADFGTGAGSAAAFERLCARYREPHRRYHGLAHVVRVLREIADLAALPTAPTVSDLAAVRVAGWYHDAVYDVASATNESDSADLAARELALLARPARQIALVRELILATADHDAGRVSDTAAAAVLLDADLAVLAAPPAVYQAYANGVRAEYGHLDDGVWRAGRTQVLARLLDRPTLFHVPPTVDRNARARANLAAELARWNAGSTG